MLNNMKLLGKLLVPRDRSELARMAYPAEIRLWRREFVKSVSVFSEIQEFIKF